MTSSAIKLNAAGCQPPQTETGAPDLRLAAADKAGEPHDFTGADFKRQLFNRAICRGQLRYFQHRPPRPVLDFGEHLADDTSGHELEKPLVINLGDVERCHAFAIPQHRDAIADAPNLAHPVCDINDADTSTLRLLDHCEQTLRLAVGKRSSRLVQDQYRQISAERFRDLDHLLFRAGQILDPLSRPQRKAEPFENIIGAAMELEFIK